MKRFLCCLAALLFIAVSAFAETPYETVRVEFDGGFSLSLPVDWVSYKVAPVLTDKGFQYCLGSVDGKQIMYIQKWDSDCADLSDLQVQLGRSRKIVLRSAAESSSGMRFLFYNFVEEDCSGCAALLNGKVLNLLFLPRSDADYMLTAASIVDSAMRTE